MRYKDRKIPVCTKHWTQQQDIYLIEHNDCSIEELQQHLPYSLEEIMARRNILGLTTRLRQLKKFNL